jgi:hypothetical protein
MSIKFAQAVAESYIWKADTIANGLAAINTITSLAVVLPVREERKRILENRNAEG